MSILPAAGLPSRLYTLGETSTLMHATPYYDEQGNFVVDGHNIQPRSTSARTSIPQVSLHQGSEDVARQLEPVVPPVRMTERRRAVTTIVETTLVRSAVGIVRNRNGRWKDISSGGFTSSSEFFRASERHTLRVYMRCPSLHRKMQRTQASRSNRTTL